jgi:hypothetical protein
MLFCAAKERVGAMVILRIPIVIVLALAIALFGCQPEPGAPSSVAEATPKPTCLDGYGPLDLDMVNSLSWTHSSEIENLSSCDDQHDILRQLADIPKDQRDEWIDRQLQDSK